MRVAEPLGVDEDPLEGLDVGVVTGLQRAHEGQDHQVVDPEVLRGGVRQAADRLHGVRQRLAHGAHPPQAPGDDALGAGGDRRVAVGPAVAQDRVHVLEGPADVVPAPGLVGDDEARPGLLRREVVAPGDGEDGERAVVEPAPVGVAAGLQFLELGGEVGHRQLRHGPRAPGSDGGRARRRRSRPRQRHGPLSRSPRPHRPRTTIHDR